MAFKKIAAPIRRQVPMSAPKQMPKLNAASAAKIRAKANKPMGGK
jgi:hypothetical protein